MQGPGQIKRALTPRYHSLGGCRPCLDHGHPTAVKTPDHPNNIKHLARAVWINDSARIADTRKLCASQARMQALGLIRSVAAGAVDHTATFGP